MWNSKYSYLSFLIPDQYNIPIIYFCKIKTCMYMHIFIKKKKNQQQFQRVCETKSGTL